MESNTILEVLNKKGIKQKIEIILYFSLDIDEKDYIIYKDLSEANKDMLCASQVIENDETIELNEITDADIISKIMEIIEEIKRGEI